jgi:hypothetical protein
MPARPLDLEVMHGSRHVDGGTFQATGDPGNAAWLQGQLRDWLTAAKWQPSRWREFRLIARPAGRNGPRTEVRP